MRASLLVGILSATLGGAVAIASSQPQTAPESGSMAPMTTAPDAADVFFATDSYDMDGAAKDALAKLAKWAHCHVKQAIIVEGHADVRGTHGYNADLANNRARAVRDALIAQGVRASQVVIEVHGETKADKDTPSYDRRVTARLANEGELGG
jgi:outer membrane protein OmpA-like peptidoglycan-associated protein